MDIKRYLSQFRITTRDYCVTDCAWKDHEAAFNYCKTVIFCPATNVIEAQVFDQLTRKVTFRITRIDLDWKEE